MKLPEQMNSVQAYIDDAIKQDAPRPHLGCSMLGHHCDRFLWFSYRWAVIEKFNGRMLRLFRRGQNEENTVVADLRMIGCDVRSTGANQSRVDFDKHVSGSIDGIIEKGLPTSSKRHVLEIKTHSEKSFNDLKKLGVQEAKPMHFVQMQTYMKGTKIDRALYFAVNKNTDEIYTERVRFDEDVANKAIERGHRITMSERMPEPMVGASDTWHQCKYCAGHDMCFDSKLTKEVNCRTCAFSTPKEDSTWRCERHQSDGIPYEFQLQGCDCHVLHPDLVPWKLVSGTDTKAVYEIEGKHVENGEPDANCFTSKELVANAKACANQDDLVREMRKEFNARIDG